MSQIVWIRVPYSISKIPSSVAKQSNITTIIRPRDILHLSIPVIHTRYMIVEDPMERCWRSYLPHRHKMPLYEFLKEERRRNMVSKMLLLSQNVNLPMDRYGLQEIMCRAKKQQTQADWFSKYGGTSFETLSHLLKRPIAPYDRPIINSKIEPTPTEVYMLQETNCFDLYVYEQLK